MSKYRIVEKKYSDGRVYYICQERFLWSSWWVVMICSTLEEAKKYLSKDVTITEEKVVFESK